MFAILNGVRKQQKPPDPRHVVKQAIDACFAVQSGTDPKALSKVINCKPPLHFTRFDTCSHLPCAQAVEETSRCLQSMKHFLYGDGETEANPETVMQLATDVWETECELISLLILNLAKLEFEVSPLQRSDIADPQYCKLPMDVVLLVLCVVRRHARMQHAF